MAVVEEAVVDGESPEDQEAAADTLQVNSLLRLAPMLRLMWVQAAAEAPMPDTGRAAGYTPMCTITVTTCCLPEAAEAAAEAQMPMAAALEERQALAAATAEEEAAALKAAEQAAAQVHTVEAEAAMQEGLTRRQEAAADICIRAREATAATEVEAAEEATGITAAVEQGEEILMAHVMGAAEEAVEVQTKHQG